MKRLLSAIFLLAALFATVSAQHFIIDTQRLNKAYDELSQNPQSVESFSMRFPVLGKSIMIHTNIATTRVTTFLCTAKHLNI